VTSAEIIEQMKNRIVGEFDPLRVILFGSHARGDAGVHSDVDFLVVARIGLDLREDT
jgi:predicted nucleotidyltransferase